MAKNPWIVFLQEFRKKNPQMSVVQAAKAAGVLYRETKKVSNVVVEKVKTGTKKLRKSLGRKKTKGEKKSGKKTKARR
jgi:hypothetical protein